MKICTKCGTSKPHSEFSKHKATSDGLQCYCKVCIRVKSKAWHEANRERRAHAGKEWRDANKEHCAAVSKAWYEANREQKNAKRRAYYIANRESETAVAKAWRAANTERHTQTAKLYYQRTRDRFTERAVAWYAKNKHRVAKRSKIWQQRNPHIVAAIRARRRAAELQATPKWANFDKIVAIYAEAARLTRETGVARHVDHAVPLQSKLVCGLHWEGNLQILPGPENQSKSNRYWPDMP